MPGTVDLGFPRGKFQCSPVVIRTQLLVLAAGRRIEIGDVIPDHSLGIVIRNARFHGGLGYFYPAFGISLRVAVVVERGNLAFQQVQQLIGLFMVAVIGIKMRLMRRNSPAILAVITLGPPAIQHTEIDHTVHTGLLSGCTAGLERIFRCIQPDIHTGHQLAAQSQVIAFK